MSSNGEMAEKYSVLYVEDNPQDRDLLAQRFMEEPDFLLVLTPTCGGGIQRLKEEKFDLVLLDYHLPDMTGLEMLPDIMSMDVPPPVVMLTAQGDEELVVRALRGGAVDYIPKRGDYLDILPGLLRKIAGQHRRRAQLGLQKRKKGYRVLYLEDSRADAEMMQAYLREAAPNITVQVVPSAEAGLEVLKSRPEFDLLLVDLALPGMSGLDFIREVRHRMLSIPCIVVVTGAGDEDLAVASMKLGADHYVLKKQNYQSYLHAVVELTLAQARLRQMEAQERAILEERIQSLESLLPICSNCKSICVDRERSRNPESWITVERYILKKARTVVTHGICPDCSLRLYGEL